MSEICGDPNPTATWGFEFRGHCTQPKGHDGPHRVSWSGASDGWVHEGEPGWSAPAGPPLHEQADRDGDDVPGRREVIDYTPTEIGHRQYVDNVPSDEDRVRASAETIGQAYEGACARPEHYIDEAHAAMAVADREQAELRAEVERLRAAIQWERRDRPCHCTAETGPDEECPKHGRTYVEWIERGDIWQQRGQDAEATIARVEALRDGLREEASESRRVVAAFEHVPDRASLVMVNRARAADLDRQADALDAALRGPEPTDAT